jgi:curved DNA-binding protein CbpA
VYGRVTLVVPLYSSLSMRVFKRFWVLHGFKAIFMVVFFCYARNVYNESLSDDPFTIVGVSTSATQAQVRRACRQGSLKLHPDKHPGKEDQIRPLFEKHTNACKILNNKEKRAKYVKWGTLPKGDQKQGGESIDTPTFSKMAGGGGMLSMAIYFLLFVGVPSTALYHAGDFLSDTDTLLAKLEADCKALNDNMIALYKYNHFSGLFLDIAELYLETAQAEFKENKLAAKDLLAKTGNHRGGSILDSLEGHHATRFAMWKNNAKPEDAATEKIDKKITEATAGIGRLTKPKSAK